MRISGILPTSLVNGEGPRLTIFFSGCNHGCEGCHNKPMWDKNSGKETSKNEVMEWLLREEDFIQGVTLSGGEPFDQSDEAQCVAFIAKGMGLDVWTYTGYTYEELLEKAKINKGVELLLLGTDTLVDGKFVKELADDNLAFRGSSNQRILKLKDGLAINLREEQK